MDKKLRNKILYITVGILWLVIFYRTYQNYQIESDNELVQDKSYTSSIPITFNKDTFDLILPNDDPFLRNLSSFRREHVNESSNSNNSTQQTTIVVKEEVPEPNKPWPTIEYFGFVKNRDQDKTLCMLKVNGRNLQLAKGEFKNDVYISSVFRDSVHIVFEGEERTFLK